MGFNVSQIINKILPTKEQGAIGWENPLGTPQGQIQIGNSEGLLQYYARKGLLKDKANQEVTVPSNSTFTQLLSTNAPTSGKTAYALKLLVGSTSSGIANLAYQKNDGSANFAHFYIAANQSQIIDFNGGAWCSMSTGLQVNFKPDTAGAKASLTLFYVEV